MRFFSEKPNVVLFLRAKSLDFFFADKRPGVSVALPPEAVRNQEIIDIDTLKNTVTQFLAQNQLKPTKAILVLSQEILFQKALPLLASGEEELQSKEFLEKIPFDPTVLTLKRIRTKTELYLVATNSEFYLSFVSLFEKLGWKILTVMPSVNQDHINDNYVLDPENVVGLLQNYRASSFANFMLENNTAQQPAQNVQVPAQQVPQAPAATPTDPVAQEPKSGRKKIFIALGLFLAVLWIAGTAWYFRAKIPYLKSMSKKATVTASASPSSTPLAETEATQSATASAQAAKEELTVQVLNGTGTAGFANRVKTRFEELGYANIETGNASKEASATSVLFSDKAPTDTKDEITKALKDDFSLKIATTSGKSKSFDIEIVLGK